jgi:hypothetical protein
MSNPQTPHKLRFVIVVGVVQSRWRLHTDFRSRRMTSDLFAIENVSSRHGRNVSEAKSGFSLAAEGTCRPNELSNNEIVSDIGLN